jgi:hypothetical protein
VLVRAILVQALSLLQVELAVLGAPVRCPQQSAIVSLLVQRQNGQGCFLRGLVSDVGSVADLTLV